MKTILVPTDFSEIADNAALYAASLARLTKAKIILFHSFHIPIPVNDVPIIVVSVEELEKVNKEQLENVKKTISSDELLIECVTKIGFAVDEVLNYSRQNNIDLIVMGITGGTLINEYLIGSSTTDVIRKTKTPVLVIPEKCKFKKMSKIVLASDYSDITDKSVLAPLHEFIDLFKAKLLVVNVMAVEEVPTVEKAVSGVQLEHYLEGVEHDLYFSSNNDVVQGLNEFVDEEKADMIAMIPRKHNVFQRIFNEGNTKKMTFHTHIPLLALPDKEHE